MIGRRGEREERRTVQGIQSQSTTRVYRSRGTAWRASRRRTRDLGLAIRHTRDWQLLTIVHWQLRGRGWRATPRAWIRFFSNFCRGPQMRYTARPGMPGFGGPVLADTAKSWNNVSGELQSAWVRIWNLLETKRILRWNTTEPIHPRDTMFVRSKVWTEPRNTIVKAGTRDVPLRRVYVESSCTAVFKANRLPRINVNGERMYSLKGNV